ncbi:MAG: sensor histidine kinase [Chloroflexi bacterium CFX4]|nr:sensor histidine kinase [Chloroflexi bacterium CFX4]MDL1923354.1 HAMP domain-containing histidine kinase [Chloroflexi bacterium CFX3]
MRLFRRQLLLSYLPLALLPILVIGLVIRGVAEDRLTLLVTQDSARRVRGLVPCFNVYYSAVGSWDALVEALKDGQPFVYPAAIRVESTAPQTQQSGVLSLDENGVLSCFPVTVRQMRLRPQLAERRPILDQILSGTPNNVLPAAAHRDELILTDPNGVVLLNAEPSLIGQQLAPEVLRQSAPIMVNGQPIARLALATGFFDEGQRQLLNALNLALVLSGGFSLLAALGLGWWMSSRLSQPIRALNEGVQRLARGEWRAPVPITTKNELGDLTQAFNSMAAELIRQQTTTRQMVADIAHDLRTPLSTMSLEVEAIEAGFQTPEQATESLREEIAWLQRMVDDLRLLSLMDADQVRLQVEPVPLGVFLSRLHDFWRTSAEEGGRVLALEMASDLPIIQADAMRLRQILGNLIDNALRHTKAGDSVRLQAQPAQDGGVLIRVADSGEGIPSEVLPRIFDRFYRADRARLHNDSGSGLGLSIAKRLVEMHGGTITVSSRLGHGTAFSIYLPQRAG